jgi:hypothetical protein
MSPNPRQEYRDRMAQAWAEMPGPIQDAMVRVMATTTIYGRQDAIQILEAAGGHWDVATLGGDLAAKMGLTTGPAAAYVTTDIGMLQYPSTPPFWKRWYLQALIRATAWLNDLAERIRAWRTISREIQR